MSRTSRSNSLNGWLARSLLAAVTAAIVAIACSSGKELPPLAAGGGTPIGNPVGLKAGACKQGDTAACSLTLSEHNGVLSCYHGTQHCEAGVWSGCTDGQVSYQAGIGIDRSSDSPQARALALSVPTSCLTNPCDPTCHLFNEVPDGSVVAEAGVRWPWTGGTLGGVASPSPGLNQPCKTGNDCQFNTYCSDVNTSATCSHDKCTAGAALLSNCDPCVTDVCSVRSACCNGCAPGEILSANGNRCYYIGTTKTDWNTARAACQSRGAGWDLTSISTDSEDKFVASNLTDLGWIGLNDQAVQFTWVWANGEAVSYTNWAGGQPDNNGGNEKCALMVNLTGATGATWHDYQCSTLAEYACEGPSKLANACSHPICATGGALSSGCDSCATSICAARPSCCSSAWDATCVGMVKTTCGQTCACKAGETQSSDGLSCYYRTPNPQTWDDARTICQSRGNGWDLVKIDNAQENADVQAIHDAVGADVWLGLDDRASDMTFVWASDGSSIGTKPNWTAYSNWSTATGEPNNYNGWPEDCGEMWGGGTWNDAVCTNTFYGVCEGPAATAPAWDQTCANLVSTTCDVTCGNGTGTCNQWMPGVTDPACSGVDLAVGPPCDGSIPICNHGKSQAPAGITVANMPTGSGRFGTCNPDLTNVADVQTCTTAAPIPAGQCISVTNCPGIANPGTTRDIVVNPSGSQPECGCRDNWASYTPGTTCTNPLCVDITRGAQGTPTKLDLYVLVSTEGAMYNPWWTSPTPAKSALTEFFQSASLAGVGVDLNLINNPLGGGCGDNGTCNATTCGAADVALGALTTAAAPTDTQEGALITALNVMTTSQWSQGWSLSTALQGEIARAIAHKATAPTETHAVVLLGADIWGNACSTTLAQAQAAIANGVTNGVKTYAIDVADWSIANYDSLASSGGTGTAFRGYNTSNPSDLTSMKTAIRAALDSIVASNVTSGTTTSIACSYPIGAKPVNTGAAQVTSTVNGTTTTLTQVSGSSACGNGYYFDSTTTPTTITLCPTTCSNLQTSVGASLKIQVPCPPVYTNRVTREIYQAECPAGSQPQWSLFSYDATTPEDSSIDMTFRTADTTADLGAVPMTPLATASATSITGPVCAMCGTGCGSTAFCPIDLFAKLNGLPAARLPVLELAITLNPSTPSQLSPMLNSWKVTYSCPPAE